MATVFFSYFDTKFNIMRKGRRNSLRERDKKKTNLFNKNRKRKVYPEKKRRKKNCSMRSEKKDASLRINRE